MAFGLLVLIGVNMLREAFSPEEDGGCSECADADLSVKSMFVMAVATSIDALAVGISLAMAGDMTVYGMRTNVKLIREDANGKRENILTDLVQAETARMTPEAQTGTASHPALPYTRFTPAETPASSVKKWIAHSEGFAKGELHINRQMAEVLASDQAASILHVGITRVEGEVEKDDLVRIINPEGQPVGIGKANCSASQAREDVGRHGKKPVVHYDYLYTE